ncbi:hypothetical protein M5K25_025773 [Dendrobium thyrsiflorum]|uniref:Uncharacterized protein n=1 Tax=Dendrobium thyrsiflorum TaxID=117978 RepID=A0ABD0U4M0_DENTH
MAGDSLLMQPMQCHPSDMLPFEETELDQPLVLIWQSAFASFSELFDVMHLRYYFANLLQDFEYNHKEPETLTEGFITAANCGDPGMIDQANLLQKKISSVVGEASLMMTIGSSTCWSGQAITYQQEAASRRFEKD